MRKVCDCGIIAGLSKVVVGVCCFVWSGNEPSCTEEKERERELVAIGLIANVVLISKSNYYFIFLFLLFKLFRQCTSKQILL